MGPIGATASNTAGASSPASGISPTSRCPGGLRTQVEPASGIDLKLFGFVAASVFIVLAEWRSRSSRNAFGFLPELAFSFPGIPTQGNDVAPHSTIVGRGRLYVFSRERISLVALALVLISLGVEIHGAWPVLAMHLTTSSRITIALVQPLALLCLISVYALA